MKGAEENFRSPSRDLLGVGGKEEKEKKEKNPKNKNNQTKT